MLYKNVKTGAVNIFGSVISSPDWVLVEEKAEPKAPKEAPKAEPLKEEPPKADPPKEEPEKVAPKTSRSAPKKRTKK